MKMTFSILFSVIGAAMFGANDTEKKSVFDDVLGYYCGGVDVGEDGVAAASEVRDIRRLGMTDADSHEVAFGGTSKAMTNGIRWVEEDVDCAVAGVTLRRQKCLEFTQIYTKSDGTRANANACFTLPFMDDIGAGGSNMPFTVIMRFRVPDEVRKVDGNVLVGDTGNGGNQGYLFDLGRLNQKAADGGLKAGISVGIPWDPSRNEICVGIANTLVRDVYLTNEIYRTKGACWNELALRAPYTNGKGYLLRLFQPGCKARDDKHNMHNATPAAGKKFIIGNYGLASGYAFRGKIHMFAVWNRTLSDEEIIEAFSTDPAHGLRNLANAAEVGDEDYIVGKPVFAIGNAEFGNEMFAGDQDSDAVVDTRYPSLASMPARLAVGQKVTLQAEADVYQVGYNSILRFKAANHSSHGVVSVTSGTRKLSEIKVVPGQYGSCLVPNTDMSAEALSLTIECLSAGEMGIAFDMVELGGAFAWSAGMKDGGNGEFFRGGSQKRLFEVGVNSISNFNRSVGTDVKDRHVFIPLPEDVVSKYGFRLEFAAHSVSASTPIRMHFNDQAILENVKIEKNKDYSIRIPRELVVGGSNTLWYTCDDVSGVWVNFDYMRFVPYAPVSLRLIVR